MRTFYLRLRVYGIEIMAILKNVSFNLPVLSVLLPIYKFVISESIF